MNHLEFTGERYLPELDDPVISYSHWHRYLCAQQFVEDKIVLDIACGEGYGSNFLAQNAKAVIGIDNDIKTIHHATDKYRRKNLSFIVGSVSDIPIGGKGIFNTIVSFETIEHVAEDNQHKFLDEVKRLLKIDGIFLVSTPNRRFCGDNPMFKNEFHLKEFYDHEFKEILCSHFKHVILLGHNLYAGSYIWNPEHPATDILEYNLELSEAGFRPADEGKYILYMLAVCSDREIYAPKPSILLDLSQRAYKLILQDTARLEEKDRNISIFQSHLQEKEQRIKTLEEQLNTIYNSRGWKILKGYYKVRDMLYSKSKRRIHGL